MIKQYDKMKFEELTNLYRERTGKNYREQFGRWDETTMRLILSADLWARDFEKCKGKCNILINNRETIEGLVN